LPETDRGVENTIACLRPVGGSTKRLIDIILATIGIAFLLPLLSSCMLGTLLSSPGSILARHRRVGFRGYHFDCLKFKTMAPNANERLTEDLGANPRAVLGYAETRKLGYGQRVTRFGAILRKTGIDALPQLFNVLWGDMSIVGPRPLSGEELEKYGPQKSTYLACKPGITGLWRISVRARTSHGERVMLDYTYAKSWSLMVDAKAMLLTLPMFLGSDDA